MSRTRKRVTIKDLDGESQVLFSSESEEHIRSEYGDRLVSVEEIAPELPRATHEAPTIRRKRGSPGLMILAAFALIVPASCCGGCLIIFRQIKAIEASRSPRQLLMERMKLSSVTRAQREVKNFLKAPSTAAFSKMQAGLLGDYLIVSGEVEASNSFGAPLRERFTFIGVVRDGKLSSVSLQFVGDDPIVLNRVAFDEMLKKKPESN